MNMTTKTIKNLMPFLLFITFIISVFNLDAGGIKNPFPNGAVSLRGNQTVSGEKIFLTSPVIPEPTTASQAATRNYSDSLVSAVSEPFYFTQEQGSIYEYRLLATYPVVTLATDALITLTSTNFVVIQSYITATGTPNISLINPGLISVHRHMEKISGGDIEVFCSLNKYDGSITHIATSTICLLSNDQEYSGGDYYTINEEISLNPTDQLIILVYARKTGGTNPTMRFWYGNGKNGFISLPIPVQYNMRTDASNSNSGTARTNLDVYSKEETRIYADGVATAQTLALTNHETDQSTHGCTQIASAGANTFSGDQTISNSGTDSNSYILKLQSNSAGTTQINSFQALYGANPYLRLSIASATDGTAEGVIDFHITSMAFVNDNKCDIGASGANRPKDIHIAGSYYEAGTALSGKYAALAGNVAQDFSFKIGTMGGNLKTSGYWLSNDGGDEGIYIDSSGNVGIGKSTGLNHLFNVNGAVCAKPEYGFFNNVYYSGGWKYSENGTGFSIYNPGTVGIRFSVFDNNSGGAGVAASEIIAMNIATSGEVLVGNGTDAGDYVLQANGNVWIENDCSALSFTDRSEAPETLVEAYDIVLSHEVLNGHVDHFKLNSKAWGKKNIPTGSTTFKVFKDENGKEFVKEIPVMESQPDQSKRNLSMIISAQNEVIKDLLKRIEILEGK